MAQLRVLTYNVQTGKRIDLIIDWLNRIPDTDIICLQEFPKDKIIECKELLSRVPYGYAYAEAFTFRKRTFGELTIYRKDRLKSVHCDSIPLGINGMERRILRTTIPRSCLSLKGTLEGQQIIVVNIHVVALAMNAVKYTQVEQLIENLRKIQLPIILLGDFNISSILGKKRLLIQLKKAGYTAHPNKITTHRVGIIRHQFDYVFGKKCQIIEQKAERIKYSDHYPVRAVCEF